MTTDIKIMANDNRIQLYVSDEVKKSIEAYAKYHDVSVSKAGAELLMQGAMNWSPSEETQRYKNQPVNTVNAEIPNTEYITRGEFTAMIASICAQVGITVGEVRATAKLIEQNVNVAKKVQESNEKKLKALLEEYNSEGTTDAGAQRSNVKLG
jgi:hypothetical protein